MTASEEKIQSLLEYYQSSPFAYDELLHPDGSVREQWRFLFDALERLGTREIENRSLEIRRILRDNGVTYNVMGDPESEDRIWPLDPVPFLLTSQEWSKIERGSIERAELFNLILTDLYGEQSLLKEKVIPPEIILSHPSFFRNLTAKAGFPRFNLETYSVDVARRIDGEFIAIDDRSEFHLGSGFALENRIVISRVFPSLFRDASVHRLASFFREFRTSLSEEEHLHDASREGEPPRIVLLTPGSRSDAYFEHSYLAGYLGLTLAQAGDLIVKEGKLWLRSLEGLKRVHALLRRVTDPYADPLELRGDSFIGVPGLLETVRLGNLRLMNIPGTGVLQNPALIYFLPRIAKHFLGRDLLMSSVIVQWCGDGDSFEYVKENIDRIIVRPIHPSIRPPVAGESLSHEERLDLFREIEKRPHLFVGQERVYPSIVPAWNGHALEGRHLILRSYLLSRNGTYSVMPGGLARVSPFGKPLVYSNQKGGGIKDTWIATSEPIRESGMYTSTSGPVSITRGGGEVANRVADNLFWTGRYCERLDFLTRLVREILSHLVEGGELREPLISLSGALRNQLAMLPEEDRITDFSEMSDIVYNENLSGSIQQTATFLDRASKTVRDRMSDDMRRMLQAIFTALDQQRSIDQSLDTLNSILVYTAAFSGLMEESMSRSQGWRFIETGRRLERIIQTTTFLRYVYSREAFAIPLSILRISDSERTYARRYLSRFRGDAIFDMLVLDDSNPRSLIFQALRMEELIAGLHSEEANHRTLEEKSALRLSTTLRVSDVNDLFNREGDPYHQALDPLFVEILNESSGVFTGLHERFFQQLEKPAWRWMGG